MKRSLTYFALLLVLLSGSSCGENISECPSRMCVLATGWRLTAVYVDGQLDTSTDLSAYKLTLYMPDPVDATTSTFDRTSPSGSDDRGSWELRNNDEILALIPESSPEEPYIISFFSPRQLRLIIERDIDKTGPDQYEYVLEPF